LLLLIRHFEETLLRLFQAGKIHGTTHTCLGQEYIPVAVMPLLRDDDFVFSNHRGHGHYLARFQDPEGLLAEIMGREGAICDGVGGSQHLRRGRYISTGVQGESMPVAVGAALQLRRENRGGLAVPFIGDGTWGQGAVYEALNMAALWNTPLVVIVENNGIAQTTAGSLNMVGRIEDRARAFGVEYLRCTGHEAEALQARLAPEFARVRQGGTPLVVEFETRRLGAHSKGDDTRTLAEVAALRAIDWGADYHARYPEIFAEVDARMRDRMAAIAQDVESRSLSRWSER
jgi:pyruvate dehydrogenase E1 component alpha subunit